MRGITSSNIEFCVDALPKRQARKDSAPFGAESSNDRLSAYLARNTADNTQQLLSYVSDTFGVGKLGMEVIEFLVYMHGIDAVTAPFLFDGPGTFLRGSGTLHQVCGIDKFNAAARPFPAIRLGHDRQGTTFYLFLSDQVRQQPGGTQCWPIDNLSGAVLSLPDDELRGVCSRLEQQCSTFDEFLYHLAQEGCCDRLPVLLRLMLDICEAGVLTSPCSTRDEHDLVLQAAQQLLKPDDSRSEFEQLINAQPKYKFLATLLDY